MRYGRRRREPSRRGEIDSSNPYFDFDPKACIVCSRCVRACDEIQGTFALTIQGRGFDSIRSRPAARVVHGVRVCVVRSLRPGLPDRPPCRRRAIVELGMPTRSVMTTCAYCGVGCSFKAEMKGDEVVRMVPAKDGGANEGHSCVKGRFAFGYATHQDRVMRAADARDHPPTSGARSTWDEAIGFVATAIPRTPGQVRAGSIGGITSSRCTNEEVYRRAEDGARGLRQQQRRHLRPGLPLANRLRAQADFRHVRWHARLPSVDQSDVILLIGANPTDGHPVFASRMKKRLRRAPS